MGQLTTEFPVWRVQAGRLDAAADMVAVEEPLEIRLHGEPFQVLMRLPGWEKELALGFLYTEGIVRDLSEVITIHFCGTATDPLLPPNVVDVQLTDRALERRGRRHLEVAYSSCGLCAKEAVSEICRETSPVVSNLMVTVSALLDLMGRMQQEQTVFQETGGTHGVALATTDGDFFLLAEDVGRHNAMDKVIGRALLHGRDLSRLVALLSGRISFEMALKSIRAGIPILAAVSAPTSLALNLAQELNLTLPGFVRHQRLNIYTHPHRLAGSRAEHRV
ncbi:MAG: formate dehydrogenase family accessory protein FdhD [Desulfobacca sp. RBG_16_60_12]|nr:MAG: formate dehydrogenase family accessory protein FdhD [Desulfobacca sp. RBG_16_60_12]